VFWRNLLKVEAANASKMLVMFSSIIQHQNSKNHHLDFCCYEDFKCYIMKP